MGGSDLNEKVGQFYLTINNMTKEERAAEFVKQVKNPYCFRVGDMVVKNVYSSDGISLKDRFEQFARTL